MCVLVMSVGVFSVATTGAGGLEGRLPPGQILVALNKHTRLTGMDSLAFLHNASKEIPALGVIRDELRKSLQDSGLPLCLTLGFQSGLRSWK